MEVYFEQVTDWSGAGNSSRNIAPAHNGIFISWLLGGVFILSGNLLTIVAILTTRELRTQTNGYIINLAFADGFIGLTALMTSISYKIISHEAYNQSQYVCLAGYIFVGISCSQSLLTLTLMSVDRLLYVEHPYFYVRWLTETKSRRLILSSWLLVVPYGLFIAFYNRDIKLEDTCVFLNNYDSVVSSIGIPLPGFTAIFVTSACYIRIYCIARRHQRRIRSDILSVQNHQHRVSSKISTPGPGAEGMKSAGLFLTVNCAFALCWIPFIVLGCVPDRHLSGLEIAKGVSAFFVMCNSCMNFVIYACKNKQFARAYKRILSRCVCKQVV